MKTGIELIIGLRYKLRMMGVPLDGRFRRLEPVLHVLYVCSVLDVLHVGLGTACTAVELSTTDI
jgi:hypothetical protein